MLHLTICTRDHKSGVKSARETGATRLFEGTKERLVNYELPPTQDLPFYDAAAEVLSPVLSHKTPEFEEE